MTSDLVAFLRARIDEDQRVAEAAGGTWTYRCGHVDDSNVDYDDDHIHEDCPVVGGSIHLYDEGGHESEDRDHIIRWDPARVLAEVAAKRAILDEHELIGSDLYNDGIRWCQTCSPRTTGPCLTLRLLVQPYAGHPHFHPSWST